MYSENFLEYYNYMKKTSIIGNIYRKYFIFNGLNKNLKGRCLDVGCGLGNFIRYRTNTDGADINPISINYIKKDGFKAYLIKKNKIPVKKKLYDSVIMDNVLEHIKNPNNLLLECKRVIKPNGILLIGVPGEKGFNSEKDHKIHYNQKSLILKLKKFKFKHIKTFYRPFEFSLFNNYLRQYCMYSVFKLQD